MIGIIAYPGIHFFATFKNSSFNKEWFEFYRIEFSIAGLDLFFTHITNVQVIHFVIKEHIERYLIVYLVFIKIDITCIVHRTHYILYTIAYFKNTVGAYSCACRLVKSYVIVFL